MREKNIITICAILSVLAFIIGFQLHNIKEKPVSLPEEIKAAEPNDTLIVLSVSDSIYIGFKN